MGKDLTLDEFNKLRLLYVYYATANRNPKEVYSWQDVCITLDEKGIIEKDMYQSKEGLKNKSLIVTNPQYQSELYRNILNMLKQILIQSNRSWAGYICNNTRPQNRIPDNYLKISIKA